MLTMSHSLCRNCLRSHHVLQRCERGQSERLKLPADANFQRTNHIYWIIIAILSTSVVVYIIPLTTTSTGGLYTSMMFMPWVSVASQLLLYKCINHHMPRPVAKRAAAVAMVNGIGGTANIWTSYLWYSSPRYFAAFGTRKSAPWPQLMAPLNDDHYNCQS